jgi:LemA protein
MIPSLTLLFVGAGVLTYLIILYNGLVALRNDINKAWPNIDVLLKQRHDELPRVVDVCKGYMQCERETLAQLTEARARYAVAVSVNEKAKASGNLSASVYRLFATAENYPDLKANETFLQLQKRITELENDIADRRGFTTTRLIYSTREFSKCRTLWWPSCSE